MPANMQREARMAWIGMFIEVLSVLVAHVDEEVEFCGYMLHSKRMGYKSCLDTSIY